MVRKGDAIANLMVDMRALGLPEPTPEHRFDPSRRWRFDFAWLPQKVAVEIDGGTWIGGRHTSGAGYERDCHKLNAAVLAGWRVLRFTTGMVQDGSAIDAIGDVLRGKVQA